MRSSVSTKSPLPSIGKPGHSRNPSTNSGKHGSSYKTLLAGSSPNVNTNSRKSLMSIESQSRKSQVGITHWNYSPDQNNWYKSPILVDESDGSDEDSPRGRQGFGQEAQASYILNQIQLKVPLQTDVGSLDMFLDEGRFKQAASSIREREEEQKANSVKARAKAVEAAKKKKKKYVSLNIHVFLDTNQMSNKFNENMRAQSMALVSDPKKILIFDKNEKNQLRAANRLIEEVTTQLEEERERERIDTDSPNRGERILPFPKEEWDHIRKKVARVPRLNDKLDKLDRIIEKKIVGSSGKDLIPDTRKSRSQRLGKKQLQQSLHSTQHNSRKNVAFSGSDSGFISDQDSLSNEFTLSKKNSTLHNRSEFEGNIHDSTAEDGNPMMEEMFKSIGSLKPGESSHSGRRRSRLLLKKSMIRSGRLDLNPAYYDELKEFIYFCTLQSSTLRKLQNKYDVNAEAITQHTERLADTAAPGGKRMSTSTKHPPLSAIFREYRCISLHKRDINELILYHIVTTFTDFFMIVDIDLSYNPLFDTACALLIRILARFAPSLRELNLENTALDIESLQAMDELLESESCGLVNLNIAHNGLTDEHLCAVFASLVKNHTVTDLNISGNLINKAGSYALAHYLKYSKTISCLNLTMLGLKEYNLKLVARSLNINKSLQKLILNDNQLGFKDVENLSRSLLNNNSVVEVYLQNNSLNARSCSMICDVLAKSENIQHIAMSGNNIGTKGVKFFQDASNAKLEIIILSDQDSLSDKYQNLFYKTHQDVAKADQ